MAVTSIWAVHRSIKDALDYAANPEKTENPNEEDLKRLMDYAENPDKTEQRYLISGVNCLPELAYERMMETKRRYGKYGGMCPKCKTVLKVIEKPKVAAGYISLPIISCIEC